MIRLKINESRIVKITGINQINWYTRLKLEEGGIDQ